MVASFVVKKPLSPAAFSVSGLNINPLIINQGDNIEVSADVRNTGDMRGTYQTTLSVDDIDVETKEVTLDGGSSETLSFSFIPNTAGQHKISIGGLVAPLEVNTPPPLFPPPAEMLEISSFNTAPDYDKTTNTLVDVKIAFDMNQKLEYFPSARLMLTVFHDNRFLEQVPLLTLSKLQADGQTGEFSYVPATEWKTGEYAFRAELYDGESLVQDTPLRKLTVTPGSATMVVSWKTLGIIVGGALALGVIVVALVLYFRRDMLRDYWR
jgi:hypothetical protein